MTALASTQSETIVYSPFDRSAIATLPMHSEADAEAMLETAYKTYLNRDAWLPLHQRKAILKKLAQLVETEQEEFALLIAKEGGKPLKDAKVEVSRAINGIELAAEELMRVMRGEEIPMGHTAATEGRMAYTLLEPRGVVVAVSAFNHPLNLIVHQVAPAIAVGCPVMIKPASATPLNAKRFVELVHKAGLPEAWCQFILCDNSATEKLVTDERTSFFTFIGSARVGWMLKKKLGPGTHCALEHGGVAPVIIDKTVDIEAIVPSLLKGGFYHAGQVCVSIQRIYAEQSIASVLAEKLAKEAETLITGDPTSAKTDCGPLIKPEEVTRVDEWVKEAIDAGATLLSGGKKLSDTTYAPTVLLNPPDDVKISTEEAFGPVVCVYSYNTSNEAIQRANSLPFCFQAAVFSKEINTAMNIVQKLKARAVIVNDHSAFRADWMPFGGDEHSGYNTGGIPYTMRDMLREKLMVMKLG